MKQKILCKFGIHNYPKELLGKHNKCLNCGKIKRYAIFDLGYTCYGNYTISTIVYSEYKSNKYYYHFTTKVKYSRQTETFKPIYFESQITDNPDELLAFFKLNRLNILALIKDAETYNDNESKFADTLTIIQNNYSIN
jgi:hypothetical protein